MKSVTHLAAGLTLCLLALSAPRAQDRVEPVETGTAADPAEVAADPEAAAESLAALPVEAPEAPEGDAERGHHLAYTCSGCHGVVAYRNVYPTYHVPLIGGQTEQYLVSALMEYRDGRRRHPTMRAQAESFSDQDIADLAAYLSGLGGGAR